MLKILRNKVLTHIYRIPSISICCPSGQNLTSFLANSSSLVDFFDKNATQKRGKSDYNLGFINFILDNVVVAHVEALDFRKAFVVCYF